MKLTISCDKCGAEAPNPDAPSSRVPGFTWRCSCGHASMSSTPEGRISMAGVSMRVGGKK